MFVTVASVEKASEKGRLLIKLGIIPSQVFWEPLREKKIQLKT